MSRLRDLFAGRRREGPEASIGGRNAAYERELERDFGLRYGEGGWAFEGGQVIDDQVAALSSPGICVQVLAGVKQHSPFGRVCVVVGAARTILVCDTKPRPLCLLSGLDAGDVARFIQIETTSTGGGIAEYLGTWMIQV